MPSVTFTLSDTPSGGVSVHTDFEPAIGAPCSQAQAAALDIIARTRRHYGLEQLPMAGIDIDAVHKRRDNVVSPAEAQHLAALEFGQGK